MVRTQRNVSATGHHIVSDEVVRLFLWLCQSVYKNRPTERQNALFNVRWKSGQCDVNSDFSLLCAVRFEHVNSFTVLFYKQKQH